MNKLITKARSGVTLVELLVVVLIVTILSVSLLPLLKPFVVEAQYAAEAIPVIGNLRTQLAVYQYKNGPLPTWYYASSKANATSLANEEYIETWACSDDGTTVKSTGYSDLYIPAYRESKDDTAAGTLATVGGGETQFQYSFGRQIDVDNQELVGKRCKPTHFEYTVVTNGANYCYALGCFGDDNGLPAGTGYAVCEICMKTTKGVIKQVGTWKRYKAATEGQLHFKRVANDSVPTGESKETIGYCPIPAKSIVGDLNTDANGLKAVDYMRTLGWEF